MDPAATKLPGQNTKMNNKNYGNLARNMILDRDGQISKRAH